MKLFGIYFQAIKRSEFMKITMTATIAALAFSLMPFTAIQASPADDVKAFQGFYAKKEV